MPHSRSLKIVFVLAIGSVIPAEVAFQAAEPQRVAIGATIPNLRFKDIRYVARTLDDLGAAQGVRARLHEHHLPGRPKVLAEAQAAR